MNKTEGKQSDFAYIHQEGSRTVIGYGLEAKAGSDNYQWWEVYLYRREYPSISFDDVKKAVIGNINERITEQIISGFVWEEKPVWFSLENQINFSQATAPVNLKIGEYEDGTPVYVDFETKAALKAFNDACLAWKNECLESGRAEKEAINWEPYKAYFPKEETQE